VSRPSDNGALSKNDKPKDQIGCQFTIVTQSVCPRFAYTTGLRQQLGFDFLIPGMSRFSEDELREIVEHFAAGTPDFKGHTKVRDFGDFSLRMSDSSWVDMMALGAIKHYGGRTPFAQIAQDQPNSTIDTPDTSKAWSAAAQPVWKWMMEPWTYAIPEDSSATTNLAALRGERVTEAARWEVNEWELFAGSGPDTPKDDLRVLPFATFLATDPSLVTAMQLEVGKAVWRHSNETTWHVWERAG
jgi:hypothetical protein